MQRKILYSFILAVVFMFLAVGCGSNSKDDPIAPPSSGSYSFFNASTPVIITKSGESGGCSSGTCSEGCSSGTCPLVAAESDEEEDDETIEENNSINISVQLLKNGLVEPGQSVQMRPFNRKYGEVLSMVVDTDGNGYAIFEYKAPEGNDYDEIRGQDITIQAIFYDPLEEGEELDEDENPEIILTQDFLLQFS